MTEMRCEEDRNRRVVHSSTRVHTVQVWPEFKMRRVSSRVSAQCDIFHWEKPL